MRRVGLFAAIALVPTALNASAWPAPSRLTVLLCTAGGVPRSIDLGGSLPRQDDDQRRCPKACHAGCSRKRG